MTTVRVSGWNIGFNKIRFTRLLQTELGLGLAQAKNMTDQVMAGTCVELQVPVDRTTDMLGSMAEIGAKCAVAVAAGR